MEHIPALSVDLIESLDNLYPVVLPNPKSDRSIELYQAGQRSVVDFLLQVKKEQEETLDVQLKR